MHAKHSTHLTSCHLSNNSPHEQHDITKGFYETNLLFANIKQNAVTDKRVWIKCLSFL